MCRNEFSSYRKIGKLVETTIYIKLDCERPAPSLCLMGLTEAELSALAREGIQLKENNMDDKMMGVVRHVLTAIGAVVVYMGFTDDATWMQVSGALATMAGFLWSWMAKA